MTRLAQLPADNSSPPANAFPQPLPTPTTNGVSDSRGAGDANLPTAEHGEAVEDSDLESGPQQFRVPLQEPDFKNMRIKSEDGLLSLVVREAPLRDVVTLLAETHGLNVVTADPLQQSVSVTLERVQLNDALDAILSVAGYSFAIQKNIILISSLNNGGTILSPQAQGLSLEVFQLDFATAQDVNTAVTGMLSPLGHSFLITSSPTDNRRPREIVAVNDLPQFLDRIRQYIAQIDVPPRQVMIEAHVLQVDLDDQNRHGVNLDQLFNRNDNLLLEMHSSGMGGTPGQAFTFRFSDGNLTAFLEMLRSQTDAKTLASPRLLVLNGQQARLQVGQQLGFRVTTVTETSATESVDFLDVGVVLEVTPRISRDGKIMMKVRPEVSSGLVSATTGLPEEKTTELETDILLCDHEGIVIGGLIQETDSDVQSKLPFLGDLYLVGRLFQRKETIKQRREIIVTLIPRLIPYEPMFAGMSAEQFLRAQTPLLEGPLQRTYRPWEPRLPDAVGNPNVLHPPWINPSPEMWRCERCGQMNQQAQCVNCGAFFGDTPSQQVPLPSQQPYSPGSPGPVPTPAAAMSSSNQRTSSAMQLSSSDTPPGSPPATRSNNDPSVNERVPTGRITGMTVRTGTRRLPVSQPGIQSWPSTADAGSNMLR